MQTRDRAQLVRKWSVLTHFPLTGKRSDRDFDTDNGVQHFADVVRWCVGHAPGHRLRGFMYVAELSHMAKQPVCIFDGARQPLRMDDRVVPGWDGFSVLMFAWIPRRRDVALRTLKNNQRRDFPGKGFPDGVGTSYMTDESAVLALFRVDEKGDMVSDQCPVGLRDPSAQGM